jgi:hypothetical protein
MQDYAPMISELAREAQCRETLPLWTTQPLPLGMRTSPKTTEPRPFVVTPARRRSTPRPVDRPHAADNYLSALVALFTILNIADLISTFVGLHSGMREGNPLMSGLLAHYGFMALIAYKVVVVAAVALGVRLLRSFRVSVAHATIVICDVLVLLVVVLNVAQYVLFA